jgi:hypothetical protein
VLAALAAAKLEAIVVGATAAVLQGAPLMTQDVDLLVRDTRRNREKFLAFAAALGGERPVPIADLTRALRVGGLLVPVDLLLDEMGGGLTFARVRARAVHVPIGRHTAVAACLADIVRAKLAVKRAKDAFHVQVIRETMRAKRRLDRDSE